MLYMFFCSVKVKHNVSIWLKSHRFVVNIALLKNVKKHFNFEDDLR